jgi:hypothetical protein
LKEVPHALIIAGGYPCTNLADVVIVDILTEVKRQHHTPKVCELTLHMVNPRPLINGLKNDKNNFGF